MMIRLPKYIDDLGNFTLYMKIGEKDDGHALCDLEARINNLLLSVIKVLGFGEPYPNDVTLLLADRCHLAPNGIVKDVLIRLGEFIILTNFIILLLK